MNKIMHPPENAILTHAADFADREFRTSYMAHSLRAFLADQIRALRGNLSQKAFGKKISKPQSVVSRLESEEYGKVSLQTLIDIAESLDIALVTRFVDFSTFLKIAEDFSENSVVPKTYSQMSPTMTQPEISGQQTTNVAMKAFLTSSYEQSSVSALQAPANTFLSSKSIEEHIPTPLLIKSLHSWGINSTPQDRAENRPQILANSFGFSGDAA